jgi:hypothetical protein
MMDFIAGETGIDVGDAQRGSADARLCRIEQGDNDESTGDSAAR